MQFLCVLKNKKTKQKQQHWCHLLWIFFLKELWLRISSDPPEWNADSDWSDKGDTRVGWRTLVAWAPSTGRTTRAETGKQKHVARPHFRLDFAGGTFWLRPQESGTFTRPHCSFPPPLWSYCASTIKQWLFDPDLEGLMNTDTFLKPVTTFFFF